MILKLHPDIRIQRLNIGFERAPLIVVDNFVEDAERLVRKAALKSFGVTPELFPGVRTQAPLNYPALFEGSLKQEILEFFNLADRPLRFSLCHYSLVTTPASELRLMQRIPHFDSLDINGLASVHYLFKSDLGGTAFYRHRKTGFEYIDASRKEEYFRSLESESGGSNVPDAEYINGDTPLYEQVAQQDGVFNRILIYRRNSLHSACISKNFVSDANPMTGRLSINSFID